MFLGKNRITAYMKVTYTYVNLQQPDHRSIAPPNKISDGRHSKGCCSST